MKSSLIHAIESNSGLNRILAIFMGLACTMSAYAEGDGQVALETIVNTYNVTLNASSTDGFVLSTNDNYKPGLMSGPPRYFIDDEFPEIGCWENYGSMQLNFYSEKPCILYFDYVATNSDNVYFSCYSSEEYRDEELFLSTTPQTFTQDYPGGSDYSLILNYNIYDSDVQLYIYNIRILSCEHSDDTSEPIRHIEATCAKGSHDVYVCSFCGCEYDGPEANDKLKHTDENDDNLCDVCDGPILEKMFEVSEGIELSFEPLDGTRTWEPFVSSYLKIGLNTGEWNDWGSALITITSPKDFTLSFDYSRDGDSWDEMLGYAEVEFLVTLYDESEKGAWNTGMVEPIENWYNKGSASCKLPAGTYYLYLIASIIGYRGSGDASVYNLKALYVESAIEKKAHDYQYFIMNQEDFDTDDASGIEDLNEDGKITVGDITIAIDRALKADDQSGE